MVDYYQRSLNPHITKLLSECCAVRMPMIREGGGGVGEVRKREGGKGGGVAVTVKLASICDAEMRLCMIE